MTSQGALVFSENFDAITIEVKLPVVLESDCTAAENAPVDHTAVWNAGFAAGREAALREWHGDTRDIMKKVADSLHDLKSESIARSETNAEEIASLVIGALGNVLPRLCARYGLAEISALAMEILPAMASLENVRVWVSPEHITALRKLLSDYGRELTDHISLMPSDSIGPSDIIVRWADGEAVRDAHVLWKNIESVLALHIPSHQQCSVTHQEREDTYAE